MKKSARLCAFVLTSAVVFSVASAAQTTATHAKPKTAATTAKKPAAKAGTAAAKPASKVVLTTPREKASYALGYNLGRNLKGQMVDVDPAIVTQAIKDAYAGTPPALTEDEIRAALTQLQQDTRAKMEEKSKEVSTANEKAGAAFLAANKTKPGVVSLPSGLQYKILTEGTGPKPTASDTVVCNYRGTLIDGQEFDSSAKHGQAASFPVNRVIKGWTEALQLMPVGSKWQLFIPPTLAYGDNGAGPMIAPGATLVFEVELLSIKPKESSAPQGANPADNAKPAAEPATPQH